MLHIQYKVIVCAEIINKNLHYKISVALDINALYGDYIFFKLSSLAAKI